MSIKPKTHEKINAALVGSIVELKEQYAKVTLNLTSEMSADDHGLIHGGFIFSIADYAAMVCVNEPNVVLAAANVKFIKPVKVGDTIIAEATGETQEKNKFAVEVHVNCGVDEVFYGEFMCIVPKVHVLDKKS